jgi:hypothetical protein
VSFNKEFEEIFMLNDYKVSAYAITGKDRYSWGRIDMNMDEFSSFLKKNALSGKLKTDAQSIAQSMTKMTQINRFNSSLTNLWLSSDFIPESAMKSSEYILTGVLEKDGIKRRVVYLFKTQ